CRPAGVGVAFQMVAGGARAWAKQGKGVTAGRVSSDRLVWQPGSTGTLKPGKDIKLSKNTLTVKLPAKSVVMIELK
ncbi:MAG: hypothetical protein R6W78_19565, partial [Bacteroidales bacterium]